MWLTPKLCQMPSLPQRSCLGQSAQVHMKRLPLALAHRSMARSTVWAGEGEGNPKGRQMYRGTDCQNENINTKSMASAYLGFPRQPVYSYLLTHHQNNKELFSNQHVSKGPLAFLDYWLRPKMLASFRNTEHVLVGVLERRGERKENYIFCLGFSSRL